MFDFKKTIRPGKDNIDILISENIYEHFKEKNYIFGNIYSFPNKGFFKKIFLILKLRKYHYKNIIIFDGKDRSLILAFLLKSLKKMILMEKRKLNFLLKIFFLKNKKYNLIYDNKIESYHSLYTKLLSQFNVQINETDYRFLKYEKFEFLNFPKNLKDDSTDYTLIHIDEKFPLGSAGGRIVKFDENHILLSVGDYAVDGYYSPEKYSQDFSKEPLKI